MNKRTLLAILGSILAALGAAMSKGIVIPCDPPSTSQQRAPVVIPVTEDSTVHQLQANALK